MLQAAGSWCVAHEGAGASRRCGFGSLRIMYSPTSGGLVSPRLRLHRRVDSGEFRRAPTVWCAHGDRTRVTSPIAAVEQSSPPDPLLLPVIDAYDVAERALRDALDTAVHLEEQDLLLDVGREER
jgi:hypothetical protein